MPLPKHPSDKFKDLTKQLFSTEHALEKIDSALVQENAKKFQESKPAIFAAIYMQAQMEFMRYQAYLESGFTQRQAFVAVFGKDISENDANDGQKEAR